MAWSFQPYQRRRERPDAVLVEINDRVMFVRFGDRAGPVGGLHDPALAGDGERALDHAVCLALLILEEPLALQR